MKTTKVEKVVQFKSCSNTDIANAILTLAQPLIAACNNNEEMQKSIISLAVHGWNLSLFNETENKYIEKISNKVSKELSDEQKDVFVTFILQVIKTKQSEFGGMMKGITEHTVSFEEGSPALTVETLPVNPKHAWTDR